MKLKEECGIFGACLNVSEAVEITYKGLISIQHRGQEGAGIATIKDNNMRCIKECGFVTEVFAHKLPSLIKSELAIGHTSYSKSSSNMRDNLGPFVREYLTGRIVVSNNSCITNADKLKDELIKLGIYFKGNADGEVISALIAYHITKEKDTVKGIIKACSLLHGAYSLIIACGDGKLIAVRDPMGFRPLSIGENSTGIVIASETCALDTTGFGGNVSPVAPGEVVLIQDCKIKSRGIKLKCNNPADKPNGLCVFEYVYFARPDSIIDSLSVNKARNKMGQALATETPVDADFVVGVPDSGLEAAIGYSHASGIPLATGLIKNRYVGRYFIYPTPEQRESIVRVKLNPLKSNIENRRIVLVDDSIVRGTTMARIIRILRDAGAKEVHVRISSPPFIHACNYGTMPDGEENLIAKKLNVQEICKEIGADSLGFISIEGLRKSCDGGAKKLCTACFTGYNNI